MLREFRAFVVRGNVLDLAIAVIIGAAFAVIVRSVTDDIIMPLIGASTGGLDFSSYFLILGDVPRTYDGSLTDYAALKRAGVPLLGFGAFATAVINFLIVAAAVFALIKAANRASGMTLGAAPSPTDEVVVLRQIQSELEQIRKQGALLTAHEKRQGGSS